MLPQGGTPRRVLRSVVPRACDQPPPAEITAFLDRLHAEGKRIVPGSLIWLPHPTQAGWKVAGVMIEDIIKPMERKESR